MKKREGFWGFGVLGFWGIGATNLEQLEENIDNVYETISTKKQLDQWLKSLSNAELISIDTETTSLNYMQANIVGISFCVKENHAAYLPLAHDYPDAPLQLDLNEIEKRRIRILAFNKYAIFLAFLFEIGNASHL